MSRYNARRGGRPSPALPFESLRCRLVALPETGDCGFEGLIAVALSRLSGTPFRLVGSGRQFGRDAEAVLDGAAILFEAKRYDSRLSYSGLSTKLQEALDRSRRPLEVWGAAATVPLDGMDAGDLRDMGEKHGVTVLLLDWAQALPPLAVLLAAADEATLDWFARNAPDALDAVGRSLTEVRADPSYPGHRNELSRELDRATVGLALARRRNAEWWMRCLGHRPTALHELNQPISPLDPAIRPPTVQRSALEARVREQMRARPDRPGVVVLTGPGGPGSAGIESDEGVGKTWAAVRSWLTLDDGPDHPRPLLLFMASHMWREGDEGAPTRLLARLLAIQTGTCHPTGDDVDRWERRIARWFQPGTEAGRVALVVVLDGVNERGDHPWPVLISRLATLSLTLPVRVVVTTRRGIYGRDIRPTLANLDLVEIIVEAFSDADLDETLRASGRDPLSLREPLRSFLRNPRILSVAVELFDRLDPDEVGIERLLFEYLRKRQEERAPHASHSPEQLAQTLVRHAREVRERLPGRGGPGQATVFDEDGLRQRLALPSSRSSLVEDLGDLVDSQFLRITDPVRNRYRFTTHALPLGLGLLVLDELDQALKDGEVHLGPSLDAIVDPIRAIDATAVALGAALDVALADPSVDDRVATELLHRVLTGQNVPTAQRARIFAGLRERPQVYVAVAERLYGDEARTGRRAWMRDALFAVRSEAGVGDVLEAAVRRWLRSWQPEPVAPDLSGYPPEHADQARARHERAACEHREALARLTARERAYVEAELVPMPPGRGHGIDELAIALLAGRPLLPFVDDLFAWCVAVAAGWHAGSSREHMAWLRRLAPVDWEETTRAVERWVDTFPVEAGSDTFHWAVQYALMDGADPAQARRADATWPLLREGPRRKVWTWADDFAGVNLLDPDSVLPEAKLVEAESRYREWVTTEDERPSVIVMREADTAVSYTRRLLCRFDPGTAVECHRLLARRAPTFREVSPSVLASFLVPDTAILDAAAVEALLAWAGDLFGRPDLPDREVDAPGLLQTAALPHLSADRQFQAHLLQRDNASSVYWLGPSLKPLGDDSLRVRTEAAVASGDQRRLRLTLVYAAESGADPDVVRPAVQAALASEDARLRGEATRTMVRLGDYDGCEGFAASGWAWSRRIGEGRQGEDVFGSACLVKARAVADDPDLIERTHPALWSLAVERGGRRVAGAAVQRIIAAMTAPGPEVHAPAGMKIEITRSDEAAMGCPDLASVDHLIRFSSADEVRRESGGSGRAPGMLDYAGVQRALQQAERLSLLYPLSSIAVERVAECAPGAFDGLLALVEAASAGNAMRALAVLAHDLARLLSRTDPVRATALLAHFERVEPLFPELMPVSRLPRPTLLVWQSDDSPDIVALRQRRLDAAPDDRALAHEVLAAELAGKHTQVAAYVADRLRSRHPAVLARAVTAAGFADEDPALGRVFEDERFRHGFLADVAATAKRAYDEARWARHWHEAARASTAAEDVWRFGELALACADARCTLWMERGRGSDMFERVRPIRRTGLGRAVARCNDERGKLLFGETKPVNHLVADLLPAG